MSEEEASIIESLGDVTLSTFKQIAGSDIIGELDAMVADYIRYKRLDLIINRMEGVVERLRNEGIENPGQVALPKLLPWVEGASLEEDDPELQNKWESLLANAADPRDDAPTIHRSFPRILKEIDGVDARVLTALYYHDEVERDQPSILITYPTNDEIRDGLAASGYDNHYSDERIQFSKQNLLRMKLCVSGRRNIYGGHKGGGSVKEEPQEGPTYVAISYLGIAFVEACQPLT